MRPTDDPPGATDPGPASTLDHGLRAAFGGDPPAPPDPTTRTAGVLRAIEERLGFTSRVLLRDDEEDADTLVRALPAGRTDAGSRYQVLGEIARGGVGVVMKSRDADLGRDVAMKFLGEAHVRRPAMVQRFVEEAQIAGQLQHPGILPVYELGVGEGDRPFFTMKLVKGRTLTALLDDRAGPGDERARFLTIFEQVCQAVAYAHNRGVVHRDLKPANIMVGAFGEVQVVDWGLAKVLARGGVSDEARAKQRAEVDETHIQTVRTDQPGSHSLAGSVMGTPAYMAPEQARGDVDRLDERTDVFALGGILCEILTGHPPFGDHGSGALAAAAAARVDDAFARLDACDADDELTAIARACLAPAAADRPRSAKIVADSIADYLASVEERAREADLAAAAARTRAIEERRARRLTIALAASILLAVVLACLGFMWVEHDRQQRRAAAAQRVNDALAHASVLLGEAINAPVGNDTPWTIARSAGASLEALAAAEPIDAGTSDRVAGFLEQLRRNDRDQRLVTRMEDVVIAGATHSDVDSWLWMEEQLRLSFLDYGIDLLTLSPDDIAERIRTSDLAWQLIDGFELWLATGFALGGERYTTAELFEYVPVLFAADDDPFNTQLRRLLYSAAPDPDAVRNLADSVDHAQIRPRTLSWLASACFRVGDTETLLRIYREGVLLYPDDVMINFDFAYHLVFAERWEEAIRYYIRCLGIRPQSAGIWRALGNALREIDDLDGSRSALEKAIELQPDHLHTLVDYGHTLHLAGDVEGAIEVYRAVLAEKPGLGSAHGYLGLALQEQGRLDEALAALLRADELNTGAMWWPLPTKEWVEECRRRIAERDGVGGP